MAEIEYRMFFNDEPATQEQLDRVEDITVEQEADMAWEARVEIPVRLDEQGNWQGEDEDFTRPFARVRVEIRTGDGDFVPLIDGPIAGSDTDRNSAPGQSTLRLIVRDDSAYLNRQETVSRFEGMSDSEIAEQIYGDFDCIASTEVESTPASGSSLQAEVVQRGTAIAILRALARRNGMHAYVLPGDSPGQSVGCFKPFPTDAAGDGGASPLPPLLLLGADRNIDTFNMTDNAEGPSTVVTYSLRITDKSTISSRVTYRDLELLGDQPASESTQTEPAERILPPRQGESIDLDQAATAEASSAGYEFEATGTACGGRYPGILQPYRIVSVRAGGTSASGDYLITKVTHRLTRSTYSQEFTLRRNARSSTSGSALGSLAGGIL
jgi:hypothetical protein